MTTPRLGLLVCAGVVMAASALEAQGTAAEPPASTQQPPASERAGAPAPEGTPALMAPPRAVPFVTLDQARLFNLSRYGARLSAELSAHQAELAAENRRIEADLEVKEKDLTAKRPRLGGEEFRRLADAFNDEVQRHRAEQAAKERDIYQAHERNRALFQDLANQTLAGLLQERGALAIIAEEAIVIGFRDLDITDAAIARLDALVGDGSDLPRPATPSEAAEPAAAPEEGNQTPDQTSD